MFTAQAQAEDRYIDFAETTPARYIGSKPVAACTEPGGSQCIMLRNERIRLLGSQSIGRSYFTKVATTAAETLWIDGSTVVSLDTDHSLARKAAKTADNSACARKGGARIGLNADGVLRSCWGKPRKINETITARGKHEQWVYDGGYIYLDDGIVTSIQTSR